jgi:endonuclease YncB( thermonuclease family)
LVGKVFVSGRDVNLAQSQSGMAWHYKEYKREQTAAERQADFEAEIQATASKRGLFAS